MVKYSVVIPVYRAEKSLKELTDRIHASFSDLQESFEIIFVYDCGPGNSWKVIQQLQQEYPELIKGIKLSRNFGQHNATICGFKYASGSYIITMDEDLQHRPEDIHLLIQEQIDTDADIVYGKYHELKHSSFRNITSILLKKLLSLGVPDLHNDYTAFRLIKAPIAKATLGMNNSYTFLDGYLSWVSTNVSSVIVNHEERIEGSSSYTVSKLISHSINIFVTFSILPIRLVTFSSLIIFLSSICYSIYLLIRKIFFNNLIPGYASTMIALGIGFGLVVFGIGILGEYIHRINLKTTKKPNYYENEILIHHQSVEQD